jgi:hypothetical protein
MDPDVSRRDAIVNSCPTTSGSQMFTTRSSVYVELRKHMSYRTVTVPGMIPVVYARSNKCSMPLLWYRTGTYGTGINKITGIIMRYNYDTGIYCNILLRTGKVLLLCVGIFINAYQWMNVRAQHASSIPCWSSNEAYSVAGIVRGVSAATCCCCCSTSLSMAAN